MLHYVINHLKPEVNPFVIDYDNDTTTNTHAQLPNKQKQKDSPSSLHSSHSALRLHRLEGVGSSGSEGQFPELQETWFHGLSLLAVADATPSEMSVQHMYGSLVWSSFHIPGCEIVRYVPRSLLYYVYRQCGLKTFNC